MLKGEDGGLRCVVSTSSLDLGVDFSPVDQVIQVGSPKVSRGCCSGPGDLGTDLERCHAFLECQPTPWRFWNLPPPEQPSNVANWNHGRRSTNRLMFWCNIS